MTFTITPKSRSRLNNVHPDLVKLVERVYEVTDADFFVLEGVRTLEQEKANFAKGASQTMNSRHLTGHAIDIGAKDEKGILTWEWKYYAHLAEIFKKTAAELNIPITWGGDWKTLKDGVHYELKWSAYPVQREEDVHNAPAQSAEAAPYTPPPFEGGGGNG